MDKKRIYFICAYCGKVTAGRLPRTGHHVGDGSMRFPRRHKLNGKDCPGNIVEAIWRDFPIHGKETFK